MLEKVSEIVTGALAQPEITSLIVSDADFEQGLQSGREWFVEEYQGETISDEKVMDFIAVELSKEHHQRDLRLARAFGWSWPAYSYRVGFVVGWLAALLGEAVVIGPAGL